MTFDVDVNDFDAVARGTSVADHVFACWFCTQRGLLEGNWRARSLRVGDEVVGRRFCTPSTHRSHFEHGGVLYIFFPGFAGRYRISNNAPPQRLRGVTKPSAFSTRFLFYFSALPLFLLCTCRIMRSWGKLTLQRSEIRALFLSSSPQVFLSSIPASIYERVFEKFIRDWGLPFVFMCATLDSSEVSCIGANVPFVFSRSLVRCCVVPSTEYNF